MPVFHEQPLFVYPSAFQLGPDGQPSNEVDFSQLNALVEDGAVHANQHPDFPLTVYTYDATRAQRKAPSEASPHEAIINVCRGLIVSQETGLVVARPFERMRELAQHYERGESELPEGPKTVYTKIDGSLGIQYTGADGQEYLATRGSFTGEHAQQGSAMLQRYASENTFAPDVTHLWEMVIPEGDYTIKHPVGLTLIGRIATASGIELPLPNQEDVSYPVVQSLEGEQYETAYTMRGLDDGTTEGFVVRMDQTGERIKVKHPSYKWLTMERNGEVPIHLHELMQNGKNQKSIMGKVPHCVKPLVQGHLDRLTGQVDAHMESIFARLSGDTTVKLTPQQEQIYGVLTRTARQEVLARLVKPPKRRQARQLRDQAASDKDSEQ